jgi:putative Mn2+ efflux pump MntP
VGLLGVFAIAFALAMDAFAVALVAGLALPVVTPRDLFRLSFHFGLFQAMMPLIGWSAGQALYGSIAPFDHWLAFLLLAFVGGRMIWASFHPEERSARNPTRGWDLVVLSVATSIDAMAVGLSLALIGADIWLPVLVIGLVAAGLTAAGMLLGKRVGQNWGKRVEILGGLILLFIGLRIVAEHMRWL